MKTLKKSILLLASLVVAVSAASCINDELTEPQKELAVKELATVDEQAASMEATLADIEALQTSAEGLDDELTSVVSSIENHIADLKAGASLLDGTLATLEMQKELAEVMAAIEFGAEATKGGATLTKAVASVDKKAESWLGKHFAAYYPAAKAEAAAAARLAALDLKTQKLSVEAILSDVEAGLRKNADKEELTALAAKIESNADEVAELLAALTETRTEVETEYAETVETAVTDPSGFDLPALKQFNSAVAGTLAEADNSLAGLIARVEACVEQLEDIKTRLGNLETDIKDLEGLLDMIQSVTFMSEFSAENAIAYYNLGSESRPDGKKVRTAQGTIDLRYVIRPASAAKALTASDLWDDEVKVFGYYANTITKAAPETFDFNITNVTADEAGNGIVTVTVSAASLNESFYFKETGAKLALSIATGKTDLTSKFVEIVPKDASNAVYVESIELSAKSIEIDNGTKADLDAYITPDNVTVGGVTWTTSNADVLTVTENGVIEGKSVGSAVITATTKGVDEWGNALTATCTVKVNPSIKIFGSDSVEEGKTTTLTVQSPTFISPEYITWEIGTFTSKNADGTPSGFSTNQAFASVDDSGNVSGLKMYYNTSDAVKDYVPLMVKCTIDGAVPVVLYHEIRVIAVQPLGISIDGLSDADNQTSTKVGTAIGLYGTMKPEGISDEYFKLSYLGASDGYFAANNVGTTTVTVSIQNGGTGKYSYFYPKGKGLSRNITVNVEPYYVESITLPESYTLEAGLSTTLVPVFTSDVPGKDPSYLDLEWVSSNPSVAEVDNKSGEVKAVSKGTAVITATTSHAHAVPNGASQKSASCSVTVTESGVKINVGDYYYSDGTWSETLDNSKTLVGVICRIASPSSVDTKIPSEFMHGYVVSVDEVSSALAKGTSVYRSHFLTWAVNNGYASPQENNGNCTWGEATAEVAQGYNNTLAFSAWTDNIANQDYQGYHGWTLYLSGGALETYRNNHKVDKEKNTDWYVPSQKEMTFLSDDVLATVNNSLTAAGKTAITSQDYWTSSISDQSYVAINPVNKTGSAGGVVTTVKPVRFFLAF